jgi:hypothetical protein
VSSLHVTDHEAAAVAKAPRVALSDIEAAIEHRFHFTADQAILATGLNKPNDGSLQKLELLSVCILVMRNGFTVIGKSAPASPENFNPDLGRKFAYEDAVRQLWPLMGFALRDRLAAAA